jgi:hypothetical protein
MIMRLRAVSASLPCLLISGSFDGMESVLNRCISPGAVLAKPFTPTALLETVAGLLRIGAMDGA